MASAVEGESFDDPGFRGKAHDGMTSQIDGGTKETKNSKADEGAIWLRHFRDSEGISCSCIWIDSAKLFGCLFGQN